MRGTKTRQPQVEKMNDASASSAPAPPRGSDRDDELPPLDVDRRGGRLGEGTENTRRCDGDSNGDDGPDEDEQEDGSEAHNAERDAASLVETTEDAIAAEIDDDEGPGEGEGEGGAHRRTAVPPIGPLDVAAAESEPPEESFGVQTPEDSALFDEEPSGGAAAESSAARKAPSPPGDNYNEDISGGSFLSADDRFGRGTASPRGTDSAVKAGVAARRSRRVHTMENEEGEQKREVGDTVGPGGPTNTLDVPEVAAVFNGSAPSPVSKLASPETENVSATTHDDRVFVGCFLGIEEGRGSAGVVDRGGTTDATAGAGLTPGAFKVPGMGSGEVSPGAGSSSHDETSTPILEGSLVPPHREPTKERVYDGVPVPSGKNEDGARFHGLLKRILAATVILCAAAAVVALTVTLSGGHSTTDSDSLMESSLPTTLPLTEKEVLILKHLEEVFGNIVREESTPYDNATSWILREDSTAPANDTSAYLAQRYILALLYYSTNGPYWKSKHFLTPHHYCRWHGIGCDKDGNTILSVKMGENDMVGTLPSELGLISSLKILEFYGNDLTGPLPDQLYELESLTNLWLWDNALTGTISSRVGQLSNLEYILVYNNFFSGTIPAEMAEIDTIEAIVVAWNDFTGTVSEAFCEQDELLYFYADCGPTNGTAPSAVVCECCTGCCDTARRYDRWGTCQYMK